MNYDELTTSQIKEYLRNGPYAWPGGYPIYFTTSDGGVLSYEAVKEEWKVVAYAIRHRLNDGWRVVAVDVNYEDEDLYCAHTGEKIPSAY